MLSLKPRLRHETTSVGRGSIPYIKIFQIFINPMRTQTIHPLRWLGVQIHPHEFPGQLRPWAADHGHIECVRRWWRSADGRDPSRPSGIIRRAETAPSVQANIPSTRSLLCTALDGRSLLMPSGALDVNADWSLQFPKSSVVLTWCIDYSHSPALLQ